MASLPLPVLMAGIARGDEQALARLYNQTARVVYGLALQATQDPAGAEEISLEVYLRVWRIASRYDRARGSVTAWLASATCELAAEWTNRHPGRQNRSMDEYPPSLLGVREEVA